MLNVIALWSGSSCTPNVWWIDARDLPVVLALNLITL
jgi:fumarate reductase subunit C